MRACFLGQNICALGFGVATLQSPPVQDEDPGAPHDGQFPGKQDRALALRARPGAGSSAGRAASPAEKSAHL